MGEDYHGMWADLGVDLARHDQLLGGLGEAFPEIYLKQPNRPAGMGYFDFVISEIHGLRVKELVDHKAKGGKIFGTFCLYVPDEIITALGGIAVGLCAGTDFSIPDAETELPRNLCPLIKSFYGFKVGRVCPYFQACDVIIGETTCDGKTKAYELLSAKMPVEVLEIPRGKEEADFALWRRELDGFVTYAEQVTGRKLDAGALKEALQLHNAKRRALQRLNRLRWKNPVPISGKDALLVNQIAFYDDPARFTGSVNTLADEVERRVADKTGVFPAGTPRVMTSGTPYAIPNWKLHHVAETSGMAVVAEESCVGSRYFSTTVDEGPSSVAGMLDALAHRYFYIHCACFTPNTARLDDIVKLCRDSAAQGVVSYNLAFCTPYLVENQQLVKRLKQEGIPLLSLESDYGMGDAGQLQTRLQAFVEGF